MSAVILPFVRPARATNADGAFAAVNIAARRMGYSEHLALRAARVARRDVLDGRGSAAAVVSKLKAALACAARKEEA
ncbi:hypothetical protein P6166_04490 [Stenotrophomonas sp. HITSZ_GD]|uniref:hypothetical protein n=1 Tax=Stenotrophomonas sp. HITSZ_GD TaxID=3037248 RepID=UPI00240D278D|nr:hypothetical protein [Stenotrophomonas sp. HITSZ_GD]MDG2524615.1 hypothetical protein [Stenotrophomonas sp. HITSZ_GD]